MDGNNSYYSNNYNMNQLSDSSPSNSNPRHSFAVASLVFGILAIVGCCCAIPGICGGVLAIIFAIVSRYDKGDGSKSFEGIAVAGLVLGVLGLAAGVYLLFAYITFFRSPEWRSAWQSIMDEANSKAASTAQIFKFFL